MKPLVMPKPVRREVQPSPPGPIVFPHWVNPPTACKTFTRRIADETPWGRVYELETHPTDVLKGGHVPSCLLPKKWNPFVSILGCGKRYHRRDA